MCNSKAEGGRRCEFSALVNNVRRRARRKYGKGSYATRKVEDAVARWKIENSELVMQHLPERAPFSAKPGRRLIPDAILAMLERKASDPIRGLPGEERKQETRELHERHERWREQLSEDERDAVISYSFTAFESINSHLRRKSVREKNMSREEHLKRRDYTARQVDRIDSALRKGEDFQAPQRLFRVYALPHGVSAEQFLERYMREGESFKDSAYLSTTKDPEFAMAKIQAERRGTGKRVPRNHIVLEIISSRGRSMQRKERESTSTIQSLEKEVILPRNTKLRIAGVRPSQRYTYASDRPELADRVIGSMHGFQYQRDAHEGQRLVIPTVQLVDEELI